MKAQRVRPTHFSAVQLSLLAGTVTSASGANLLLDPGLEASTPGSQTNPSWTLSVNTPDGAGTSAQFQDAPWASNPNGVAGIGLWLKAFEGEQAAGDPPAQASLIQDVPGIPGLTYELSAFFKVEANYTSANTYLAIDFLQGAAVLGSEEVDLNPLHPKDASWQQYMVSAVAPAGTDTVRARAEMVDGTVSPANPQSAMFDDFNLEGIPEPSAAGFVLFACALAVAHRRRRQ